MGGARLSALPEVLALAALRLSGRPDIEDPES
jgi:hypothetical protein